jgi:thioredoxin-related protein
MPYEYDLEIARQNRIGRTANDFTYTLASGRTATLHNIKADYTLIFISNPGCPMCREVKEQITTSPMLQELIERKELKVLVIYPDTDLEAWREHLQDYPVSWINGYDADQRIEKERLYDLKAIPALYLLDKQKRVMAKDCTDVAHIEKLLSE